MMPNDSLLHYAIENDLIDLHSIWQQYELNERKKYLEKHKFKRWINSKGEYCTYLPDELSKRQRKLVRRKNEILLEDTIVAFYKSQEQEPTLKQVFYMWADRKLEYNEIFKQTYDRYENDFERFFKGTHFYNLKIKYITESDLEEFIRNTIRDKNLSAKGWANLRLLLNGMFKYAKKYGYTTLSITNFIGDLDISRKAYRKVIKRDEECVFTEKEQGKIIDWILKNDPCIINYGIVLAFITGLRAGELSTLQKSDIKNGILNVSKSEIRYKNEEGKCVYEVRPFTKGEKGFRNVILTDLGVKVIEAIISLNPNGKYLFEDKNERIKGITFTHRLEKICKSVNILPRSLHKARKTYATQLLNANVSERLVLNQMGHIDISTTKNYYFFNNVTYEKAHKEVSDALISSAHYCDFFTENHTSEIAQSQ